MSAKPSRPKPVTITLVGVILIGTWYAGQLFAIIRQYSLLLALNITPDPGLRLVFAAIWMVLFWGAAAALWRRRSFVTWLIPLLLILAAVYELTMLGLYVLVPVNKLSWLLRVWLYLVTVLFAFWSLNRSPSRLYFSQKTAQVGSSEQ